MRVNKKIVALSILPLFAVAPYVSAAQAGSSYAGVGYGVVTYEENDYPDLNPTVLVGRFGHYVADNVAIEARLGFGMSDDSTTVTGVNVSLDIDHVYGIYAVGHLPVGKKASLYALVGYTHAQATATASVGGTSVSLSDSDSDVSYGIGAEYAFAKNVTAGIEYTSYIDKDTFSVSAAGVGISLGF